MSAPASKDRLGFDDGVWKSPAAYAGDYITPLASQPLKRAIQYRQRRFKLRLPNYIDGYLGGDGPLSPCSVDEDEPPIFPDPKIVEEALERVRERMIFRDEQYGESALESRLAHTPQKIRDRRNRKWQEEWQLMLAYEDSDPETETDISRNSPGIRTLSSASSPAVDSPATLQEWEKASEASSSFSIPVESRGSRTGKRKRESFSRDVKVSKLKLSVGDTVVISDRDILHESPIAQSPGIAYFTHSTISDSPRRRLSFGSFHEIVRLRYGETAKVRRSFRLTSNSYDAFWTDEKVTATELDGRRDLSSNGMAIEGKG